ncbi:hypothetical protein J6590_027253 [Homalodisca vitripennis]|nr:hypothetical protein J6590_027253 [Homalodisca vitripennis]
MPDQVVITDVVVIAPEDTKVKKTHKRMIQKVKGGKEEILTQQYNFTKNKLELIEIKPKMVEIKDLSPQFASIKLRKPHLKKENVMKSTSELPKILLKSLLRRVPYPPTLQLLKITELHTVTSNGILSRNYEEAVKIKKKKIKKVKLPEDEKVELEVYVPLINQDKLIPKEKTKVLNLKKEKIEIKEVKPLKLKIEENIVGPPQFATIKLKKTLVAEKKVIKPATQLPKVLLKSLIKRIPYPPEMHYLTITEINVVVDNGILSRNYEEAMKIKKKKIKKVKLPDIEKAELEEYVPFTTDKEEIPKKPDEVIEKAKPVPEVKEDQPEESISIKIGKGKIPEKDELVDNVKLKKVPPKPADEEEVPVDKTKKIKPHTEKPKVEDECTTIKMTPIKPYDSSKPEEFDELKQTAEEEKPTEKVPEIKLKKPKKVLDKPEPVVEEKKLILGKPKEQPEEKEDDVSFKYKQGELPKPEPEEIKLKPFMKEKPEEEKIDKELSLEKPEFPESQSVIEEVKSKEFKTKDKPKKKIKKKIPDEEMPEEQVPLGEAPTEPLKPEVTDVTDEIVPKPTELGKKKEEKEKPKLMKIERLEQKATKLKVEEVKPEELFSTVKLRKSSVGPKKEIKPTEVKKILLKSLIKRIPFPPQEHIPVITVLEKVELHRGILSRNYEEAKKVKKPKSRKVKLSEPEKTELEKYEPGPEYVKPKEDNDLVAVLKPKEKIGDIEVPEEEIKLKIGKGKIPEEDIQEETVKLKKIPEKTKEKPVDVTLVKETQPAEDEVPVKEVTDKELKLEPLADLKIPKPSRDIESPSKSEPEEVKEKPRKVSKKQKDKKMKEEDVLAEKVIGLGKPEKQQSEFEEPAFIVEFPEDGIPNADNIEFSSIHTLDDLSSLPTNISQTDVGVVLEAEDTNYVIITETNITFDEDLNRTVSRKKTVKGYENGRETIDIIHDFPSSDILVEDVSDFDDTNVFPSEIKLVEIETVYTDSEGNKKIKRKVLKKKVINGKEETIITNEIPEETISVEPFLHTESPIEIANLTEVSDHSLPIIDKYNIHSDEDLTPVDKGSLLMDILRKVPLSLKPITPSKTKTSKKKNKSSTTISEPTFPFKQSDDLPQEHVPQEGKTNLITPIVTQSVLEPLETTKVVDQNETVTKVSVLDTDKIEKHGQLLCGDMADVNSNTIPENVLDTSLKPHSEFEIQIPRQDDITHLHKKIHKSEQLNESPMNELNKTQNDDVPLSINTYPIQQQEHTISKDNDKEIQEAAPNKQTTSEPFTSQSELPDNKSNSFTGLKESTKPSKPSTLVQPSTIESTEEEIQSIPSITPKEKKAQVQEVLGDVSEVTITSQEIHEAPKKRGKKTKILPTEEKEVKEEETKIESEEDVNKKKVKKTKKEKEVEDILNVEDRNKPLAPEKLKLKKEKIEVKEIKPQKIKIEDKKDETPLFASIKLKKTSVAEKKDIKPAVQLPKVLLKSLIKRIPYPPEMHYLTITEINVVVDNGILSRNYEEAMKIKKKKIKKVKLPDIEKAELEEYVPFTTDKEEIPKKPDEVIEKAKPVPEVKEDQPEESISIKIGKGKIPEKDELVDNVKLKKVPPKPADEEEVPVDKTKKIKPHTEKPKVEDECTTIKMTPIKPYDSSKPEEFDELKQTAEEEKPTEKVPEIKLKKPKKVLDKPEPVVEEKKLILGKPKEQPEEKEDDVSFKYKQGELPKPEPEEIKLKPFMKEKPEEEKIDKELSLEKPEFPESQSVIEEVKSKEFKTKDKPKKKIKKKIPDEEMPEEQVPLGEAPTEPLKPEVTDVTDEIVPKPTELGKKKEEKEKPKLMKIERLEQKATKLKVEEVKPEELFSTVKLRKSSVGPKKEIKPTEVKKILLKSLIKRIPFPPQEHIPVITVLEKVELDRGILSRNYEEAKKVKKPKPRKVKLSEPEKTELEKYEPGPEYVKPKEDNDLVAVLKPKEKIGDMEVPEEEIKLKIGKGKIPEEDIQEETVKLKKIPEKTKEEPVDVTLVKETQPAEDEVPVKEVSDQEIKLEPLADLEIPKPSRDIESPSKSEPEVKEKPRKVSKKQKDKKMKEEDVPAEKVISLGKPIEQPLPEEESITLKKPKQTEPVEITDEKVNLKLRDKIASTDEVSSEQITIKKKKSLKPTEEVSQEVTINKKLPVEEADVQTTIVKKKVKAQIDDEVAEEYTIKKSVEMPEEELEDVIQEVAIKKKKPLKISNEEVSEEVIIKPKKKPSLNVEEDVTEEMVIKKKPIKKPYVVDESSEEITIKKELSYIVGEESVAEEFIVRKDKPIVKEQEEISEEFVIKPKRPSIIPQVTDDVEEELVIKKKPKPKPQFYEEAAEELTITQEAPTPIEKPLIEDTERMVVVLKKSEKPVEEAEQITITPRRRSSVRKLSIEEHPEEKITLKQRRPSEDVVEEEVVTDVTFKPKITKPKEEIEQEFKISLQTYEEEDISMSGKVRLPRKKKIQPVSDEASAEITIQKEVEIEQSQDINFPLRGKPSVSAYNIEDMEQEVQLGLRQQQHRASIVYEEETLDIKVKRKPSKPTIPAFNQESAGLTITKGEEITIEKGETIVETSEGDILFSICSYVAENDDALNLVEGERVYVLESTSQDWWFVQKHLTEEKGWVPAVYLRDEPSYTLYVQKKLHEKIDKLPIFEKPSAGEEVYAPRFVEKLQPKHAPDGATVQFECQVEGNPRPQITWFRQTAIIKPSQDFQIFYDDDNVATLIIREVFPEDAGTFTCVAKNAAGFASSTTELLVEAPLSDHGSDITGHSRKSLSRESSLADILEGIPPTFSRKPKAKIVKEGDNVELECRLVAVPEPDIFWYYKGKALQPSDSVSVTTQSDMHMYSTMVTITKVKKSQEGVYQVVAKNREGQATLDITLKVKTGEPEPPEVVEPLQDVCISEGESAVLVTQITGKPTPKIVWSRDGQPDTSLPTKVQGETYSLTFIKPSPSDSARYSVTATNKHGKASTSCQLTVEDTNLTRVDEFHSATDTFGSKEVKLRTVQQQQAFKHQEAFMPHSEKTVTSSLTRQVVQKTHQFTTTQMTRPSRAVISKDNVHIVQDLKMIKINLQSPLTSDTTEDDTTSEVTIEITQKINVPDIDVAHDIKLKKYEETEISEKVVTPSQPKSISHTEETSAHIIVTEIVEEGQEFDSSLNHLGVPGPQAPLFVERFEEQNVKEKGTIRLVAKVTGNPVPIVTWFSIKNEGNWNDVKNELTIANQLFHRVGAYYYYFPVSLSLAQSMNNKTLLASPKQTQLFDGENIVLEIKEADSEEDAGDYKCVASNNVGTATHGSRVTVDVEKVSFTKLLRSNVELNETETVTLECETSHTVSTKWRHNGAELSGMDHRELVQEGRSHRLIIKRATLNDAGTYTCGVKDQLTSCTVVVHGMKPDFVRKLEDFEVKEQEVAILEVEISSETADVTWIKDGLPIEPVPGKLDVEKKGNVRKLLIRSTSVHDEGEYTCTLGDQECTAEVTVIELPPQIHTKMQDVIVTRGDKATLEVELTKGDALVRWFKDDKELHFSEHVQLSIDGKKQKLKIYQAELTDGGTYSCRVGDQPDQVSTARVTVEEPEVEFVTRLPDVTLVPINTDAEFTVELSRPVDVRWLKKGKEIKPSSKYIFKTEGNVQRLIIKKATTEDQTDITCTAFNVKTSTKLKVEKVETAPRIKVDSTPKEYKVKKGEDVNIEVKFTASPAPTDEWTMNGTVIKKSKRVDYTLGEESACLTIKKVEESDVGTYTLRLKNPIGEASAEMTLIIMRKLIYFKRL